MSFDNNNFRKTGRVAAIILAFFVLIMGFAETRVFAEEITRDDINAARLAMPVSSNSIPGWPQGPPIGSESACLMDSGTGVILYAKNMDVPRYPASTTKVLTCLVAAENSSMDEIVTFSKEAVFGIERGSSNVGMDVGQQITMEEALYCIMLASANEVASAVAEHVGGSISGFCEMMNKKAAELGCTNTHFCNSNGLPNEEHLTTAHDLALITRAFNNNETLRRIAGTNSYTVNATATQPDTFTISNHHKMYPGNKYAYEWLTWGKTGYTNVARETLVSCAEKEGLNLVCVVMKGEPPYQFTDTRDLFEYGFSNFKKVNIAESDTKYNVDNSDFFDTDADIFGNTKPLLSLDTKGYCVIPKSTEFESLDSMVSYEEAEGEDVIAKVYYGFNGYLVGQTDIKAVDSDIESFDFGSAVTDGTLEGAVEEEYVTEPEPVSEVSPNESVSSSNFDKVESFFGSFNGKEVIFVNVRKIVIIVSVVIGLVITAVVLLVFFRTNRYASRRRRSIRKRNKRYTSEFDDFDF